MIWTASWQNQQNECAPSEDSDQPGHPPSLIRVFAVRIKKPGVLTYPLSAQRRHWSDWADAQADLSLRWRTVILLVLTWGSSYHSIIFSITVLKFYTYSYCSFKHSSVLWMFFCLRGLFLLLLFIFMLWNIMKRVNYTIVLRARRAKQRSPVKSCFTIRDT